jgi:hypothetical protein
VRKPEQNGVLHPHRNTLAGDCWAMFDEMGRSFAVKQAINKGAERGLNANNIRTELCNWRKYHGIKMS